MTKPIVYKIEEGMNPEDYLATTYQMRNFFVQLGDGFFTQLDVMNYIQHLKAVRMIKKDWKVLDMCCGRSLLLPLIRYHGKNIGEYVGVDISEKNIQEAMTKAGYNKRIDHTVHYTFPHKWIESNVSEMSTKLESNYFDFIIYTSSIEHMHKDEGVKSLAEAYKVLKPGGIMFISCPRTEGNGYNTQYKAHIYEWGLNELITELEALNFQVCEQIGLLSGKKELKEIYELNGYGALYEKFASYLPNEFLLAFLPIPFPEISKEVLIIVKK